jgi:hypothetical protein
MFVKLLNLLLNMKTTTKLLSILFLIMLLLSCDKDTVPFNKEPLNTYYYLSEWQLNQTPYFTNPAFDTISFASDKGDTLTFVKTKTQTTWNCERTSNNPSNFMQDCFQRIHNTYATIKGIGSFDVYQIETSKYSDSYVLLKFNDKIFYYDDVAIDYFLFPRFIGDIVKNNKSFKNVIYLYHSYSDSLNAISYANKDFGVFYIDDKINNLNYLITK